MVTITVTVDNQTPITYQYDHLFLKEEQGVTFDSKGTPTPNGQKRININGWTGIPNWGDYVSDAEKTLQV